MKNILAVIAGIVLGGVTNMALIMLGSEIIPPPEGVDPSDVESIKANMHLYEPIHFLVPFVAHALGTLVGALVAGFIATKRKKMFAMVIGAFYLLGGIAVATMLPAPTWFTVVDLVGAYLPMGWLGGTIASRRGSS